VEKGTGAWEEYRNFVRACRDATRKAKVHLELNLARDVKDNKKSIFKYISSKRKTSDNVGLLWNEAGALVMEDTEKAVLLPAFFASVFTAKAGPQSSQSLEVREKACRKKDLPLVEEDQVRDHLSKLDTQKSMGPAGMHSQVLRELTDVIAEPLSITFERSWRTGEVPQGLEESQCHSNLQKGKEGGPRELQAGQPHLHPGKGDGAAHSGGHQQASGGKEIISSSQHGFTKVKSCLTILAVFYDGVTGWVDEGRAVDVVYLDFSKAFDTVSHNIFIGKVRKCGLDERTVRWIENWLNGRAQRVEISGTVPSWRPVTSGVPRGQYWAQSC